jgi:hypothetical protein
MPNEQTSVPLFTSGEVLTAANMNISAGTGVPVFTNTTTRDAGFGGAGEKVLAEGQLCYLSSTNVVQYYDGAAWATVGPSTASGLVFLSGGTVTASASANFDSVFSATYDNYRVIISDITTSGTGVSAFLKMRVGGVTNSAAAYTSQNMRVFAGPTTSAASVTNDTGGLQVWSCGTSPANNSGACIIDFTQPFLAKPTTILSISHVYYDNTNSYFFGTGGGTHIVSSSFDGFNINQNTTTCSYKYKIYGYSNS